MNTYKQNILKTTTLFFLVLICISIFILPVHALENQDMQTNKIHVLIQPPAEPLTTLSEEYLEELPMPHYNQYDYSEIPYMGKTIAERGCGIVSASMIATYLLQDETLTPEYLAETYGDLYNKHPEINYDSLMTVATTTLEYLGIKLTFTYDFVDVVNALIEGKPVLALENPGLFTGTPNGHFIVYESMTDNGRFIIHDSNGYNWERNAYYHENGFPYYGVYDTGSGYWICETEVAEAEITSEVLSENN